MNIAVLIGRLTKDPEIRYTTNTHEPKAVATFTLAVDRQKKESEADFIRCVAFGKTADLIGQYVSKGNRLAVQGSIRTGSYQANDGSRRYTTDIMVNRIEFLESANRAQAPQRGNETASQQYYDDNSIPEGFSVIDENDVPF